MLSQPGLRALNLQKVRMFDRLAAARPELAAELRGLKLNWYSIRNADSNGGPETDTTDVFIYDEIGGSMGVQAETFVQELNDITTPNIVVRINSPGGMLIDGIAIASAFEQHPSHITTRVDSMAASAASVIFAAGDTREMVAGSQAMVHDALVDFRGNAADMREMTDWLDAQSANVSRMYARHAGGTAEEWRSRMLAETWFFDQEAVDSGLATGIFVGPKSTKSVEPVEPTDSEDAVMNSALQTLMSRKHRITNRGYKYTGRDAAPAPEIALANAIRNALPEPLHTPDQPMSEADIDKFIAGMQRVLGGK